jgi:oxidoreductase
MALSFLVFGATGATGKAVLQDLVSGTRDICNVVVVGRRPLDDDIKSNILDVTKVKEVIVDSLDSLNDTTTKQQIQEQVGPVDIAYCCLGTTRAAAGSADAFRKVDVEYVDISASFAKSCGAKVFGLISAQGANKNLWASDWKPFHGLLYSKCKGLAEECVVKQGFDHTVIMRPGLLDREDKARFGERMFKGILPTLKTRDLARVMITQSIQAKSEADKVRIYEMKEMQKLSSTFPQDTS